MHDNRTLRKTKYGERGEMYFQGERASDPELPWRKFIRENLPKGFEGFVCEDVDLVVRLFDPATGKVQRLMLLETKWWNVQLDRSQLETLRQMDEMLRRGDTEGIYAGCYVLEWHRTDEFARINYQHTLAHYRLPEFFLGNLKYPSYFEK